MLTTETPAAHHATPPASEQENPRVRDVVVWGTAGPAYVLTDALRAAGLSVGSWLLPPCASPRRATAQAAADLRTGAIPTSWRRAPAVVTAWADPRVGAALDPLTHSVATECVRLECSPAHTGPAEALHLPLLLDEFGNRAYLPAATDRTVTHTLCAAALPGPAARVLQALLTLPRIPATALRSSRP